MRAQRKDSLRVDIYPSIKSRKRISFASLKDRIRDWEKKLLEALSPPEPERVPVRVRVRPEVRHKKRR